MTPEANDAAQPVQMVEVPLNCSKCGDGLIFSARYQGTGLCNFCAHAELAKRMGVGPHRKATDRALAMAKNGIISINRTPAINGSTVFVDGKEIRDVYLINVLKGYVCYYPSIPRSFDRARIYGLIDVEPCE